LREVDCRRFWFRLGVRAGWQRGNGLVDNGRRWYWWQRELRRGCWREHDRLGRGDFCRQGYRIQRRDQCWRRRWRSWVRKGVLWIIDKEGIKRLFTAVGTLKTRRTRRGDERFWYLHLNLRLGLWFRTFWFNRLLFLLFFFFGLDVLMNVGQRVRVVGSNIRSGIGRGGSLASDGEGTGTRDVEVNRNRFILLEPVQDRCQRSPSRLAWRPGFAPLSSSVAAFAVVAARTMSVLVRMVVMVMMRRQHLLDLLQPFLELHLHRHPPRPPRARRRLP